MSLTAPGTWLNTNSGAVQAVSTVVLVGVTAWYVHLMRQQVETSRQDVETSRRLAAASEAQVELLRAERDEKRSAGLKQLTALARASSRSRASSSCPDRVPRRSSARIR